MKLSFKILVLAISMISISVLIISGTSLYENLNYNEKLSYERVESCSKDLNKQV